MAEEDPFAGGTEIGEKDPFAAADDEFSGFDDPVGEDDIPIVDREGDPVPTTDAPEPAAPAVEAEPAQAPEPVAEPKAEPVAAAEAPAAAEPAEATAREQSEQAAQDSLAALKEQREAGVIEAAPVAAEPATPEPAADVARQADEAAARMPEPTVEAEPAAAEVSDEEVSDEDAPEPEEKKDKDGKVIQRRYYLLRETGKGKFERVYWYEDDKGKMVSKGVTGAKRQSVCIARGADAALKIGYAAVGSPADGARLVAVAGLHFQVVTIRPKPVLPQKASLEIVRH